MLVDDSNQQQLFPPVVEIEVHALLGDKGIIRQLQERIEDWYSDKTKQEWPARSQKQDPVFDRTRT